MAFINGSKQITNTRTEKKHLQTIRYNEEQRDFSIDYDYVFEGNYRGMNFVINEPLSNKVLLINLDELFIPDDMAGITFTFNEDNKNCRVQFYAKNSSTTAFISIKLNGFVGVYADGNAKKPVVVNDIMYKKIEIYGGENTIGSTKHIDLKPNSTVNYALKNFIFHMIVDEIGNTKLLVNEVV